MDDRCDCGERLHSGDGHSCPLDRDEDDVPIALAMMLEEHGLRGLTADSLRPKRGKREP